MAGKKQQFEITNMPHFDLMAPAFFTGIAICVMVAIFVGIGFALTGEYVDNDTLNRVCVEITDVPDAYFCGETMDDRLRCCVGTIEPTMESPNTGEYVRVDRGWKSQSNVTSGGRLEECWLMCPTNLTR